MIDYRWWRLVRVELRSMAPALPMGDERPEGMITLQNMTDNVLQLLIYRDAQGSMVAIKTGIIAGGEHVTNFHTQEFWSEIHAAALASYALLGRVSELFPLQEINV